MMNNADIGRAAQRFGAEPIPDDGVKLATLQRGPNCELRVRWREFKGHHFLDIREWSVNRSNAQWFPTKGKGIAIKRRELGELRNALDQALALVSRRDQPRSQGQR